ncbi:MAG TPA: choice-of-anchor L domain-containing protein [Solirubrobacteraceae bacterium]|nr:choice-of-anchor L domain-containing protein [Solirubrobacteraceae bacterium]
MRQVCAVLALASAIALSCCAVSFASGVSVNDLNSGATPAALAQSLVGAGVSVSNVAYKGSPRAAGTFVNGASSIGFESGVVLSSGKVETYPEDEPCSVGVEGPNNCQEGGEGTSDSDSTQFGEVGDPELTSMLGIETHDAAALEFDFVPAGSTLQLNYVFGSEEYDDFVNAFNDGFALFVNGSNCALVPGTSEPVSVDTVNDGSDTSEIASAHPEYFRNNVGQPPPIDSQLDGLTTVLTCSASVEPGVENHMKLVIADALDEALDSAVFLQAGSITSSAPPTTPAPPSGGEASPGAPAPRGGVAGTKTTGGAAVAEPAAPVAKATADVGPANGSVLIKVPGSNSYAPLGATISIPLGTLIDASKGTVKLTSAKNSEGETESGLFSGGVFRVEQALARSPVKHGKSVLLTVLVLAGPLPVCSAKRASNAAAARRTTHQSGRRLWGEAKGDFRTEGRYASATVRGTRWLTEDTCAGTIVRVARGIVSVHNVPQDRNVLVRAPHALLVHP